MSRLFFLLNGTNKNFFSTETTTVNLSLHLPVFSLITRNNNNHQGEREERNGIEAYLGGARRGKKEKKATFSLLRGEPRCLLSLLLLLGVEPGVNRLRIAAQC